MTIQIDKKGLMNLMNTQNEKIMDLLISFNVPDSVEDDDSYEQYLLPNNKSSPKGAKINGTNKKSPAQLDELEERLNTIRNKLKAKKRPMSDRAQKKRDAKKLKKNKEFKKVLISATKSIKNENNKKTNIKTEGNDEGEEKQKTDIKPIPAKTFFNEEGKIVFSKFDFAAHPGAKVKKSHQNPRDILKKINETNKKLTELKEQGEDGKASELQNELAWKKAFDKIEGKKVKDDPKLLVKAIKKRKVEKKKSKQQWTERKEKVETEINQRQKKRTENLNKRIKDKKNKKLKNLTKRGRVVPGF